MVKITALTTFGLLTSTALALAQSAPNPPFYYGFVPTAAQWNLYFQQKQDAFGFPPLNKLGDVMQGRLVTSQNPGGGAGFNLPPATTPSKLQPGDLWMGSNGIYYYLNGTVNGPLSAICQFCALTSQTNTFQAMQQFNLNAVAVPQTPLAGTAVQAIGVDGSVARMEIDTYGTAGAFTTVKANGTKSVPTALLAADTSSIGAFNFYGYNGLNFVATGALRCWASENWNTSAIGSNCEIATTANGTTISGVVEKWWNDGGVTVGTPSGGDKGAGTINVGNSFVGGVQSATLVSGTFTPTVLGAGTAGSPVYTVQVGSYTAICPGASSVGCRITVQFTVATSSLGGASGNIQVGNFPYTSANTTNDDGSCSISQMIGVTLTTNYTWLAATVSPGFNRASLQQNGSGQSVAGVAATALAASTTLIGVCNYHT